tara:strand:+ start:430 stop:591 length:162 start_codon:yes stop_codon:yes gene_type:complete
MQAKFYFLKITKAQKSKRQFYKKKITHCVKNSLAFRHFHHYNSRMHKKMQGGF